MPESLPLDGMQAHIDAAREEAAAERGRDLSGQMLAPAKSINAAAGKMEMRSPLFSGTDANPQKSLF